MKAVIRSLQRVEMKKKANLRKSDGCKAKRSQQKAADKEEKGGIVGCSAGACGEFHRFTEDELSGVQSRLLEWYDVHKRDLPWRKQILVSDVNQRAYGVWVSEIMLQQTQVATVVDYYTRWMKKWPTLQDLAEAKLEAVNEMWSGLGYYSRAKRLHQGAQKVVQELGGQMPTSREALQRHLPGVGRYTAGAIASIALAQKCGVVDGNVIRVLSRLRMIGANSAAQATMDAFWELAESLAVCERPGDLNQGLMELGARVCTPRAPLCSTCPLAHSCKAFAKVEKDKKRSADRLMSKKDTSTIPDIECLAEGCGLCLPTTDPWNSSLGVENFPRKAKKKAAREQRCCVCVVRRVDLDGQARFLTLQRPHQGLLAGLWEFPSTGEIQPGIEPSAPEVLQQLRDCPGLEVSHAEELAYLGQVVHIFSHIHQTYLVSTATVIEDNITMATEKEARWLTRAELDTAALPTAMRKVFKLYRDGQGPTKGVKRKAEEAATDAKKQQRSIDSFFTPKR